MSHLSFRELNASQVNACAQVISSAYNVIATQYGFQPDANTDRLVESLTNSMAARGRLYGAYAGDTQVGAFLLIPRDCDVYELTMLSVIPARQGIGYGSQLLEAAEQFVLAMDGIALVCTIIDDNAALKKWLLKTGFRETMSGWPAGSPCNISLLQKQLTSAEPKAPAYDIHDGDKSSHYEGTSCSGGCGEGDCESSSCGSCGQS